MSRVVVSEGVFKRDGKEVVLLGGNYVMKCKPHYPDPHIVRANARELAEGAKLTKYKPPPAADGASRAIVPAVRLSAMMDAAMPEKDEGIDPGFKQKLETSIEQFAAEGVYVFLDVHQDALCTTNGGNGFPWWVAAEMQKTAGCCLAPCCCCCCFKYDCLGQCCPASCQESIIATPEHPLRPFCGLPNCIAHCLGLGIETYEGDAHDPWRPYSVTPKHMGESNEDDSSDEEQFLGPNYGNPADMNVGNASVRMNNADGTWSRLGSTTQLHNLCTRIYNSPFHERDRELFFEPYVEFIKYLCQLWEKYSNIVAVEFFNEPPIAGLPNLGTFLTLRRQLWDFYGAVLEELAEAEPAIRAPIALDDWTSSVPGESCYVSLFALSGISTYARNLIRSVAEEDRLILSFHRYEPPCSVSFAELCEKAQEFAESLGPGVPLWLSEYFEETDVLMADVLVQAIEHGCHAATYWQMTDREFTGESGWFRYPASVKKAGSGTPVNEQGEIDPEAWEEYQKTVADGTFWGATITGACNGRNRVLRIMPEQHSMDPHEVQEYHANCHTFLHKARGSVRKKKEDDEI